MNQQDQEFLRFVQTYWPIFLGAGLMAGILGWLADLWNKRKD